MTTTIATATVGGISFFMVVLSLAVRPPVVEGIGRVGVQLQPLAGVHSLRVPVQERDIGKAVLVALGARVGIAELIAAFVARLRAEEGEDEIVLRRAIADSPAAAPAKARLTRRVEFGAMPGIVVAGVENEGVLRRARHRSERMTGIGSQRVIGIDSRVRVTS